MRLIRYRKNGITYPGKVDYNGRIYDLSSYINDIDSETLSHSILLELSRIKFNDLRIVLSYEQILPCIKNVGKIICVGLNYLDHIKETGAKFPREPVIFCKLCRPTGAYDDLILPKGSQHTDWEVELAVIIGKRCQYIEHNDSSNYVAGYCIMNDISERNSQLHRGGQWLKGKSYEGFAPLGPWLVTKDAIKNVDNLNLYTKVDSVLYQNSNTNQMVFSVDELISYLSRFMVLYPGDVISTGTPSGVGIAIKPYPIYLKPNQVMSLGIENLGTQKYRTIQYK